jgi:hypothetical protein
MLRLMLVPLSRHVFLARSRSGVFASLGTPVYAPSAAVAAGLLCAHSLEAPG